MKRTSISTHVRAFSEGNSVPPPTRKLTKSIERAYSDILLALPIDERHSPAMITLAIETAETIEQLDRANAAIRKLGDVLTDDRGKLYPNPWVKIRNDSLAHLRSNFGKLRLYPAVDTRELQRVNKAQRLVAGSTPAPINNVQFEPFVYPEGME